MARSDLAVISQCELRDDIVRRSGVGVESVPRGLAFRRRWSGGETDRDMSSDEVVLCEMDESELPSVVVALNSMAAW